MNELSAERYDAWYRTPRGACIGDAEFRLLAGLLQAAAGERLLDVGCGTGYFTRRFARDGRLAVTGIDPDPHRIAYAAAHASPCDQYLVGDARELPFPDRSFDCTVCVTALCFIADERAALREMLRVTRRRLVLGLLNRASLLYLRKRATASYRGAHWHTARDVRALFGGLPAHELRLRSAVFLPGGGAFARRVEAWLPASWLAGGFLAAAVDAG